MISYNTGASYPRMNRKSTTGDLSSGDTMDWSTVGPPNENRQYAIRAIVSQGTEI